MLNIPCEYVTLLVMSLSLVVEVGIEVVEMVDVKTVDVGEVVVFSLDPVKCFLNICRNLFLVRRYYFEVIGNIEISNSRF